MPERASISRSTCAASAITSGPMPSPGSRRTRLGTRGTRRLPHHVRQQPARLEDLQGERGERREVEILAARQVAHQTFLEVDLEQVARRDAVERRRALDGEKAVVERVAEERPRERARHHRRDLRFAQRPDRLLARRPAAELRARYDDVALLYARREGGVDPRSEE